jgi:Mg2+/Co2+ transporter CorB
MIALGAFFSGSETGVYRFSRFSLRLGVEQKKRFYSTLNSLMADSHALVFSILLGNNLVNYIATSIVTYILLSSSLASQSAAITTAIMTPVLFIFSEVIPKNIYYHRSDVLMPRSAPLLWFFHKLFTFTGIVALLKLLSKLIGLAFGLRTDASRAIAAGSRDHITQIIRETREEGFLSPVQNAIMHRLVNIPRIKLNSVKVSLYQTQTLNINSNRQDLMKALKANSFTRYPVYELSRDNIIGYINIYEALSGKRRFGNLKKFLKPIPSFDTTMPVIEAINQMQRDNCKIILVCRKTTRKNIPLGIATMKDLVEELTGELTQW